jgi:hypothetical protein
MKTRSWTLAERVDLAAVEQPSNAAIILSPHDTASIRSPLHTLTTSDSHIVVRACPLLTAAGRIVAQ